MTEPRPLVRIVEDDAAVRDSLVALAESWGYEAEAFPDAEARARDPRRPERRSPWSRPQAPSWPVAKARPEHIGGSRQSLQTRRAALADAGRDGAFATSGGDGVERRFGPLGDALTWIGHSIRRPARRRMERRGAPARPARPEIGATAPGGDRAIWQGRIAAAVLDR